MSCRPSTNGGVTSNGQESSVFRVHISNIPLDLDDHGFHTALSEFGRVRTNLFAPKANAKSKNGWVTFYSYDDAEKAVRALNAPDHPLEMRCEFKDQSNRGSVNPPIDLSRPIIDPRYKDSILDQNDRKPIEMGVAKCTPTFDSDLHLYNPYEPPNPFYETNLMYTRGITHITRDGRRHISCGRGYTYYELPEPHYNIEEGLRNVYEKRERGLYEYASEELDDDIGPCKYCSNPTQFMCQKCSVTYYCGRACQKKDWDRHRSECVSLPPLAKKIANLSLKENGHNAAQPSSQGNDADKGPLRRPRTVPPSPPQQQKSGQQTPPNDRPKDYRPPLQTSQQQAPPEQRSPPRSVRGNANQRENGFQQSDNHASLRQQTPAAAGNFKAEATSFPAKPPQQQNQNQARPQQNQSVPQQHQARPQQNQLSSQQRKSTNEDDFAFKSNDFLPKNRFVEVMVTHVETNKECFVTKTDDVSAMALLVDKLGKFANSRKLVPPEQDVRCIIKQDQEWLRAKILHLDNVLSTVFNFDFGTVVKMKVDGVVPIDGFEEVPYYARKIFIAEGNDPGLRDIQPDDFLSVKALNVRPNGTIEVHAKVIRKAEPEIPPEVSAPKPNGIPAQPTPSAQDIAFKKLSNIPNVLDTLKIGTQGFLMLFSPKVDVEFNVTLVPQPLLELYTSLLEPLMKQSSELLAKNPNFIPKVGDLVSGLTKPDEWFRGLILSVTPSPRMIAIDEARICTPLKCVPLMKNYVDAPALGLSFQFAHNTQLPKDGCECLQFEVIEVLEPSKGVVRVSFDDESGFKGEGLLKKWQPMREQTRVQWATVKSGHPVVITHYSNQSSLYVRSKEPTDDERNNRLDQDVAKYALDPKPLDSAPVVGQMVLTKFELDGNFYRALVKKIEAPKVMIMYVDYGNDDETTIDKLLDLPDQLKMRPSCVARIKLMNVDSDIPLTEDAANYFLELIGNNALLKCTFEGDPIKDGVILKTQRNECVNEVVTKFLKPTWEKEKPKVEEQKIYTIFDLPAIKLGDAGDEIEAIALYYYKETNNAILGPNDVIAAQALQNQLGGNIKKYVETVTDHYIPREDELCIAKYQDEFYRALCIDPSASPTESRVYFIDYGNTEVVNHKDIRMFTEDFASLGSYGTVCNLSPMVPNPIPEKVVERIHDLMQEVLMEPIKVKIIKVDQDDTLLIDIPHIHAKLSEEKLI
ncbi:hypothetical protein QAD02_022585 [Eretmocerus hayati]|uniref:Uncharacterized protein n=1 Tax=Eretmocerus hayati TaxID=131215 RepID=A0ACC2PV18_9HYME|nr:hypothetical protein QAD02_022585 [Eretmocerus hayati]